METAIDAVTCMREATRFRAERDAWRAEVERLAGPRRRE